MSNMRTPLSRVRGLGAGRGGTEHFWQQRLTAISNLVLITIFLFVVISLSSGDYDTVRDTFANPLVGVGAALVIISFCIHMRLGMQTIIEDYIHGPARWPLTIANVFFPFLIAGAGLFAIVKLSFGG